MLGPMMQACGAHFARPQSHQDQLIHRIFHPLSCDAQLHAQAPAAQKTGAQEDKFDIPEPFSGVATGAAFGGAFGAGIGALYDAHHNRKVIEEIEARAEHSKPNAPQNYGNATADMTDLSST